MAECWVTNKDCFKEGQVVTDTHQYAVHFWLYRFTAMRKKTKSVNANVISNDTDTHISWYFFHNHSQPFFSTLLKSLEQSLHLQVFFLALPLKVSPQMLYGTVLAGPFKDMQGLIPEPRLHCDCCMLPIVVVCFNVEMVLTCWLQFPQLSFLPDQNWVDPKLYKVILAFYFLCFTMMEPSALWGIILTD